MKLALIVRVGGLQDGRPIRTKIGQRMCQDSEYLKLDEKIKWYAEFSAGTAWFRRINETTSLQEEFERNTSRARNTWEQDSYGVQSQVITDEEAERLIQTAPYQEDPEE